MIEIFRTTEPDIDIIKIDNIEKGCWINIISPTEQELNFIQSKVGIYPNFLRDPLDDEEKPRIDVEDDQKLIIVDIPYAFENGTAVKFETLPMGILVTKDYFITICLRESTIVNGFKERKVKGFFTFKKTRFMFQLLFSVAKDYLKYLRQIDKRTDEVERALRKSMKNKELFKLLELEKSLVFFTTSLKSNEMVMEKLFRGKYFKMYEEDQDLLEDVIIENKQAIEMAGIYSSILNGMMGTFASVISNNLNMVMKFLTSVTIVMAIPTMIASFFGMNVQIPFGNGQYLHQYGFVIVAFISLIFAGITALILSKRKMF